MAHSGAGRKELNHPQAGLLVFEHAAFHPVDDPEQRLILYSPAAGTGTAEKLDDCAGRSPPRRWWLRSGAGSGERP